MKKVLWVKFGWSEYYRGGPVDGNFGWLNESRAKNSDERGHELFNFMPADNGTYYCYVPPQVKHAPWNGDNRGWTVVCLAKHPEHKGIHVVGWYENATLVGKWRTSPFSSSGADAGQASSAYKYSYCITSKSAFFVPPKRRTMPFSDPSVRQGKYSFLVGPGVKADPGKDRVLKILETRLAKLRDKAVQNPSETALPDPELDAADPLKGFGTPEHRRKVEKAAEEAVKAYYLAKGFNCVNRTKESCGYDFLFWKKGARSRHVEVKGTSSENAGFFITHNEYAAGYQNNPAWQLAMVTRALSDAPVVEIFDAKRLGEAFDMTPYVYIGRRVPEPEST